LMYIVRQFFAYVQCFRNLSTRIPSFCQELIRSADFLPPVLR
jgi:hypothetical protein